uniref:Uncharacterized protein n=1 Tax=Setaria viridis TaxID=4556 RepID=A0A4U6WBT1_SETVI|nr:hypothetical protein SEVIR_2G357166v2 [Setaria viridis]
MPSPLCRCLEAPASPRQLAALADDLLEEILLRVSCPADLARASAASSPTPPSSAGTAPSTRRSSSASSRKCRLASTPPRRPTPTPPPRAPSPTPPPASPSTTSLPPDAIGNRGTPATCAMAASFSRAAPLGIRASTSPTSRCATPFSGGTGCCLPYPTTYSPPSTSSSKIFHRSRPSLFLLEKRRMGHHLE